MYKESVIKTRFCFPSLSIFPSPDLTKKKKKNCLSFIAGMLKVAKINFRSLVQGQMAQFEICWFDGQS